MFRRCALRLCECIHLARKRGVLSRRSTAGSGSLVARHRQVHASCETETGNGHKCRSAKQAHRYGVLGYKGACRKRLATCYCVSFRSSLRPSFGFLPLPDVEIAPTYPSSIQRRLSGYASPPDGEVTRCAHSV